MIFLLCRKAGTPCAPRGLEQIPERLFLAQRSTMVSTRHPDRLKGGSHGARLRGKKLLPRSLTWALRVHHAWKQW